MVQLCGRNMAQLRDYTTEEMADAKVIGICNMETAQSAILS